MHYIGVITRGSLDKGIEMKLDAGESIESVKAGTFVVIEGHDFEFFSMITDVTLDAANDDILLHPPGPDEGLLLSVLQGSSIFTTVKLKPMLMVRRPSSNLSDDLSVNDNWASSKKTGSEERTPEPVKTVPSHFSRVRKASEEDVARIFGKEDPYNSDWFSVGTPLDMESPVCVDLRKFVERSNGIFGKSGTGKTFLTRTMLAGLIHHQPKVANLIFDVHNEYAWETSSEGGAILGLARIFGSRRVKIYSLDAASSRTRGVRPDEEVKISLDQIEPDDILSMQDELNLADAAAETAYQARNAFGKKWLSRLLDRANEDYGDEPGGFSDATTLAQQMRAHEGSVNSLQRKLQSKLIRNNKLLPFLTDSNSGRDIIKTMLHDFEQGISIVLEFGGQQSMLAYLLVANVLTRRIHQEYVQKHEEWIGRGQQKHEKPNPLMITIEEAHKFLNPQAARQTIFGTIARELRKYGVTLLVVDQRPSGIDNEVMSQIGTRITAQLNDENDIQAVLTGVSGAAGLKGILAQLDSKQQALVMGYSVPMPVVIETRYYGPEMWKSFGYRDFANDSAARSAALDKLNEL